jgi:4-amino-4-deoxy-L-arabinose transferase-like glycosyltransferase
MKSDTTSPASFGDPLVRYTAGCLAAVLLVALALRLWGINYGLPYVEHPDEPYWVNGALRMIQTGDPNPHDFIYPSLMLYVDALAYLLYFGIGRLFGAFHSLADLIAPVLIIGGSGKTAMPALFLVGRSISLALGLGTVVLTFDLARRSTGYVLGGVLAGLWVAFSPIAVTHDRYMVPDGPMTFFTTLTLWAAWWIFARGRTRDYILPGIALGLAVGTKYNVAPFVLPIVLAHFLRAGWRGIKDWRLYAALGLSLIAFLATTPFAILDAKTFYDGAFLDIRHYTGGHAGNAGNSLGWYLNYFWQTDGPVLILAAAGIVVGIVRRAKGTILIAATMLGYLLFISAFAVHFERTAVPLAPLFALLAAEWAMSLDLMHTPDVSRSRLAAAGALIAIVLAFPLFGAVRDTIRLTTPDGRDTSQAWIEQNLPPGSRIAVESYAPWVDPQKFSVQSFYKLNGEPPEWFVAQNVNYLIVSQRMFHRFYADPATFANDIARYEALFQAFEPVKIFTDGGYEVRIYRVPPRK